MAFVDSYFETFKPLIEQSQQLPRLENYNRQNAAHAYGEDYKAIIAAIQMNDEAKIIQFFQDCLPGGNLFKQGYQLSNHLILEGLYEAVGHERTAIVKLFLTAAQNHGLSIINQKQWHGTIASRSRNMLECALEGNNPDIVKLLAPHFKTQINNSAHHESLLRYASKENQKLLITEYDANPGDCHDPELNKLFISIIQTYILSSDLNNLKKYTLTGDQLHALEPLYNPKKIVNISDEMLAYLTPLLPMNRVFLILVEQTDELIVEKLLSLVTITSRRKFIDKLLDLEYILKNNPAANPKILKLLERVKSEQYIQRAAEQKFEYIASAAAFITTTGYLGHLFYSYMHPNNPAPNASTSTYSSRTKPPKQPTSRSLKKRTYCTTPMHEMQIRRIKQPLVPSMTTAPFTRLLSQSLRLLGK